MITQPLMLFLALALPQSGEELDPSPLSLEEVRLGLEALTTSWHTREMHYITVDAKALEPLGGDIESPDAESAIRDYHSGIRGYVQQTQSGQLFQDNVSYNNQRTPFRLDLRGFDGNKSYIARFKHPLAVNPADWMVDGMVITGPQPNWYVTYPFPADLDLAGSRKLFEWLNDPSAKVLGQLECSSALCVRVTVDLPEGIAPLHVPQQMLLDIDPALSFWPRRILFRALGDDTRVKLPLFYCSFERFGEHWFPMRMLRGDVEFGRAMLITKVAINPDLKDDFFFPPVPAGVKISDQTTGTSFVSGGEGGHQKYLEEMERHVAKQREAASKGKAVSVRTSWSPSFWLVLGAAGLLLIAIAMVLFRRKS